MKTNKKGISLIVLVVTIIVLAILAATVIISIVNTGIINSAKDAVEAQKLGQVQDIASVAWGHALIDPSISTPEQYLNYIISVLKDEGYTDAEIGKYTIVADVNGVTVDLEDTETDEPVIPEYAGLTITKDTPNVTFTKADGVTPGDPDNIEDGDIVIYGDYEYRYNYEYCGGSWATSEINGWGVKLKSDCFEKTTVGELCGNIYGKMLVSMSYTFHEVVYDESGSLVSDTFGASIIAAPQIPNTVEDMSWTFGLCTNLVTAPAIPSSVTDMFGTFENCSSLTTAPEIPASVTNMESTFFGCENLTKAPDMSRATSVTNMDNTFAYCENLTTAPEIPASVTNMAYTFCGCSGLTTVPDMSRATSVTIMYGTFENCSSLTTAPEIPASVTNMQSAFYNCSSLTTAPEIPASVTNMAYTFAYCENLTKAPPAIPSSVTDMCSTFASCSSLTTAPVIPSIVENMRETFSGCTSLTGTVQINSSIVSNVTWCFICITNSLTVKVPANSTTYTTITEEYGSSSNVTIDTF